MRERIRGFTSDDIEFALAQTARAFYWHFTDAGLFILYAAVDPAQAPDVLARLRDEDRIAFRYVDARGEPTAAANPNGAADHIAGVLSPNRRVLGMMPHPERLADPALGGADGAILFDSLCTALAEA